MTTSTVTGFALVALPIAFNAAFIALAARFDYPDVLRRPTSEVLARFREGGSSLVLLWWGLTLTAVALAPLAVLLAASLTGANGTLLLLTAFVGVLAALVQFLGLVRWPFLVPYLARVDAEPDVSEARREAVDVVFQSFNRYLGVAVGEHLGYLFTGSWSLLVGFAVVQSDEVPAVIGVVGVIVGVFLALCSLEFVGSFEQHGWTLAGRLVPVVYVVWSVWLAVLGVALLL